MEENEETKTSINYARVLQHDKVGIILCNNNIPIKSTARTSPSIRINIL